MLGSGMWGATCVRGWCDSHVAPVSALWCCVRAGVVMGIAMGGSMLLGRTMGMAIRCGGSATIATLLVASRSIGVPRGWGATVLAIVALRGFIFRGVAIKAGATRERLGFEVLSDFWSIVPSG